ncbi:MAG TPA: iron uptake transporter permease EfeU [Stackebrandtia sp.]|jgi:high-affinity iron transporter|uniref:iron uptake transporter permease EfeU n=1 Tax=Stackebrandtia sp. TaxID=2023065 RepID=UPI002D539C22|nr:iron uptake transporter permease EfeU [Stackebrandtia sp.]HZE37883.1 iron uptake transporter permease EfeU [Stackebrandtia sp.]
MFATFLIGLREGLEVTLVVSILVAFLVKSGRKRYLWHVWGGVAVAVALSVGAWAVQTYGTQELTPQGQEAFEAAASVIAVVFVTIMIFWMRTAARRIGKQLRAKLEDAINVGPLAVVVMAFLVVVREGLETSVLLYSTAQATGGGTGAMLTALAGVAVAVAIGFGLYYGAVSINLGTFFRWTGILLILVAAGIFKYAVHAAQEANVLGGLNHFAFDASGWYDINTWYGRLLEGMFNLTPTPTVLETIAWAVYLVPVLTIFLWPAKPKAAKPAVTSEKSTPASEASAPAVESS